MNKWWMSLPCAGRFTVAEGQATLEQMAEAYGRAEDGRIKAMAEIRKKDATIKELTEERDSLQATFDLRWKADMRAIKNWQASTGKDLTWPDHADLVVWLLERQEELVEALKAWEDFDNLPLEAKRPDVFDLRVLRKVRAALAKHRREA